MTINIKFYSPDESITNAKFSVRAWLASSPSTYYDLDIKKDKKNSKFASLGTIPDDTKDFDIHYWVQDRKTKLMSNVKSVNITKEKYEDPKDPQNSIWIKLDPTKPAARPIIDGGSPEPPKK